MHGSFDNCLHGVRFMGRCLDNWHVTNTGYFGIGLTSLCIIRCVGVCRTNRGSVVTPVSVAGNIVFLTSGTSNVACFAGVILFSVTT